jgi:hypothetical protein
MDAAAVPLLTYSGQGFVLKAFRENEILSQLIFHDGVCRAVEHGRGQNTDSTLQIVEGEIMKGISITTHTAREIDRKLIER